MCQFYRSLPDHPHLPGIAGRETNSVGNKGKQRALDYLSKRVQGKIPCTDCRVNTHFLMLHPLNHLYLWRGLLQVTVPNFQVRLVGQSNPFRCTGLSYAQSFSLIRRSLRNGSTGELEKQSVAGVLPVWPTTADSDGWRFSAILSHICQPNYLQIIFIPKELQKSHVFVGRASSIELRKKISFYRTVSIHPKMGWRVSQSFLTCVN